MQRIKIGGASIRYQQEAPYAISQKRRTILKQ
jgi:hypothetical protein